MPLGTLDRSPPPFFKQGQSALSRMFLFSALALFLMVADTRLQISQPLRSTVITLLQPAEWLARQPVLAVQTARHYFDDMLDLRAGEDRLRKLLAAQSQRANQVEQLIQENNRLRKLLALREQVGTPGVAAEVLYDAADPFARRVIVDKGLVHGIEMGSPVIDEAGVLGQVTRVHPLLSEVTLVIDRDHAIPILNTRTGARNVVYGDPTVNGGALELRFMTDSADVQQGDLLTTSGVDGIYPAGLPVATVSSIERRGESTFARIFCTPRALVSATRHVLILRTTHAPPRPAEEPAPNGRKAARK